MLAPLSSLGKSAIPYAPPLDKDVDNSDNEEAKIYNIAAKLKNNIRIEFYNGARNKL